MERKASGRTPWAIVLLVLAFVCALSYGIATISKRVVNQSSFGRAKVVDIANVQKIQATSGGFVYYDGSAVSALNSAGDVKWSYMVGGNAEFEVSDYGVAAWTGQTITLIDSASGSTTYNGTMDADVHGACIGEKYTAILTGTDDESTIVLMENGGRQLNRIELSSLTAIDYGFFANGSLMWVMVCNSNGTVPTCDIQTYKPGKEIVGSITDTEQLMYAVMFQSSQICVAGEIYLKTYDYNGTEDATKRRLIYGWYMASADNTTNDPLMAFVKDSEYAGESDVQDIRLLRSNIDETLRMPFGCREVVARGNVVYGFAADGHVMMARTGSQKVEAYQLNLSIDHVYGVTDDHVAVIGSGSNVYLVNLE